MDEVYLVDSLVKHHLHVHVQTIIILLFEQFLKWVKLKQFFLNNKFVSLNYLYRSFIVIEIYQKLQVYFS